MVIKDKLKKTDLPKVYKREGKDCYFDTYRKKLIEITPEETVRQRVAAYLEKFCSVPKEMIYLEVPMSHYVKGAKGRADIVIHAVDEKGMLFPITVVECKNEDVFLTNRVEDQAVRYCDVLGAKYIIITNGVDAQMAAYDDRTDTYQYIDGILSYESMLNQEYIVDEIPEENLERFSLEEIQNQDIIAEYNEAGIWIFGSDSSPKIRSFATNFYQCLLDTDHKLPAASFRIFELIEDIGLRYMDYSNAGGGHYNGLYRAFLVKDRFGETQIVSFSIFGTDANFRNENRRSYTSITVSVDSFKTSHNSLQYNVDSFVEVKSDGMISFSHSGRSGNLKNSDMLEKVMQCGELTKVLNGKVELGEINTDRLLYLDSPDIASFFYCLIEYALLRDEARKEAKR